MLTYADTFQMQVGMPILAISVSVANIYLFILNAAFWQGKAGLDNFPSLGLAEAMAQVLTLLALLVQKYKY